MSTMKATTPDELVARAKFLAPLFAEYAGPSEALRHPADEATRAAEDAEIFKLMVPRRFGGLEFDLDTFVEVVLAPSEGDASLAWMTAFLIEHNWMLCLFPEEFQEELYSDQSPPLGQRRDCRDHEQSEPDRQRNFKLRFREHAE